MPNHGFFKGFQYAFRGILAALRQERNLRFHLATAVFVLYFGRFYSFTRGQWATIMLAIGGVIALEMANSAIERAVDRPSPDRFYLTGAVKDMAAGAVLCYSISAAAAGIILFWQPAVLIGIWGYFIQKPLRAAVLLAALIVAWCFVFGPEWFKKENKKEELPREHP